VARKTREYNQGQAAAQKSAEKFAPFEQYKARRDRLVERREKEWDDTGQFSESVLYDPHTGRMGPEAEVDEQ
jgi:hypothetical protein